MQQFESNIQSIPAHITGLFKICENEYPLQKGSLGAGFCINNHIKTKITLETAKVGVSVLFNNRVISGNVSKNVAMRFRDFWRGKHILIEHFSKLPIGGGFGTSGAGALGTAFAMNQLFKCGKSTMELGQIAHRSEIETKSGLGDVIGQFYRGTEIRTKPGAPGIGEIKRFTWDKHLQVLTVYLGSLSTKAVIGSATHIERINSVGSRLVNWLRDAPTSDNFVQASYEFAVETNLMTQETKSLVDFLRAKNLPASMIMIGKSAFAFGKKEKLEGLIPQIKQKFPTAKINIDEIY